LEQAGLLGHSMGGKVAMYAALAFPNRVRHLIVADIAPVSYRRDYTRLIAAMRGVNLEAIESRSDADQVLKAAGTDESLRPFLLKNLKRDGQHFNWRINLDGIAHNLSTLLSFPEVAIYPPYSEPTMLIRGELSDFVLPEHRSTIQQYFPRARFVTVKEAGHWLHVERPYGFMGAVDTFLKLAY
jgi:esterase